MAHRRLFLLCIGLLLLAACDGLGSGNDREPIRPLAVGNYWAYTVEAPPFPLDSFRVEITRAVELPRDGQPMQTFAEQLFFEDDRPYSASDELYAHGPGGLYRWGRAAETDTLVLRQRTRKYPAEVGEAWPFIRVVYNRSTGQHLVRDTLTMTLVATDEEIETPAGTFTCYVYKYSFLPADDVATPWDVYDYFAPGVGNVAQIIRHPDDEDTIVQEVYLYDYRVQ